MTKQKPHYRISKKGRKFKAGRGKKKVKKKMALFPDIPRKGLRKEDTADPLRMEKIEALDKDISDLEYYHDIDTPMDYKKRNKILSETFKSLGYNKDDISEYIAKKNKEEIDEGNETARHIRKVREVDRKLFGF